MCGVGQAHHPRCKRHFGERRCSRPLHAPVADKALHIPTFCRVVAVAKQTSDSVITFEVWIPNGEPWNQTFLGVGNGGYNGAIYYEEMADALNRGIATASTDTGHPGSDLAFAVGHPENYILGLATLFLDVRR